MSLLAALQAHDVPRALELLFAGADPNELGPGGRTPLIEAAQLGDAELVKRLLDAGADPSLADGMQETALLKAAAFGHRQCVAVLEPLASADERATARSFLGAPDPLRRPPERAPSPAWQRDLAAAGAGVSSLLGDEDPRRRLARLERAQKKKR